MSLHKRYTLLGIFILDYEFLLFFFFFKAQLGGFLPYEGLSAHSILDPHMPGPYLYSILIKQHDTLLYT